MKILITSELEFDISEELFEEIMQDDDNINTHMDLAERLRKDVNDVIICEAQHEIEEQRLKITTKYKIMEV